MLREYLKTLLIIIVLDAFLIGGIVFYIYRKNQPEQNTIVRTMSTYIKNTCLIGSTCKIDITEFTSFEWDTVCFVDSGASLDINPQIIPATLPEKYSLINAKIIFLLKKQIVLFEETPIGVESIAAGTVLSDENGCFSRGKDTVFNVGRRDDGSGDIYILDHSASTTVIF